MNNFDYNKYLTDMRKNKARLLKLDPRIPEWSGIYVFTRVDKDGFKFAYIGQARKILTRLAQHLTEHKQHIDNSLHNRGLFSESNSYGWAVRWLTYAEEALDLQEQIVIKHYADMGYQLYNVTGGSQGKGKVDINERKPAKGYYDGKKQGATNLSKELQKTLKYLVVAPKDENKRTIRMYNKFWDLLTPKQKGESDDGENETN